MNFEGEELSIPIISFNFESFVREAYHAFQTLTGQELLDFLFEDFDVGQTSLFSRVTLMTLLDSYAYSERLVECAILAREKFIEAFGEGVRDLSVLSGHTMNCLAELIVEAYALLESGDIDDSIDVEYRNRLREDIERMH